MPKIVIQISAAVAAALAALALIVFGAFTWETRTGYAVEDGQIYSTRPASALTQAYMAYYAHTLQIPRLERCDPEAMDADFVASLRRLVDVDQAVRHGASRDREAMIAHEARTTEVIRDWLVSGADHDACALGLEGVQYVWLLAQHSSDMQLVEAAHARLSSPEFADAMFAPNLATMEDRIALEQTGRQIYGTQARCYPALQKKVIYALNDPHEADRRRREAGLPPLAIGARLFAPNGHGECEVAAVAPPQ